MRPGCPETGSGRGGAALYLRRGGVLVCLAENDRRFAGLLGEAADEMTRVAEAQRLCDAVHGEACLHQRELGLLDAPFHDVFLRRIVVVLAEEADEILHADAAYRRELFVRDLFGHVRVDIGLPAKGGVFAPKRKEEPEELHQKRMFRRTFAYSGRSGDDLYE